MVLLSVWSICIFTYISIIILMYCMLYILFFFLALTTYFLLLVYAKLCNRQEKLKFIPDLPY